MKNRWLIAAAAVGIHISIGSVYAWSMLNVPLMESLGLADKELWRVTMTFTLAIVFLGLSAAFLGRLVEKLGPKKSGILAAFLFGLGLMGSGLAVRYGSIWLLYLSYGVIGGMGLGTGYIAPVSTLMKWFPDRRGLAMGIAVMGFGFASFIARFLISNLLQVTTLENMFYLIGAIYFTVMLFSAWHLSPPPAGYGIHAGESSRKADKAGRAGYHYQPLSHLTTLQAVGSRPFYYLWLMMFINITCGIAVISVAKNMGAIAPSMDAGTAGMMVALMGIFNGLGRIGWSSASDYMGRPKVWVIFIVAQIVIFFSLSYLARHNLMLFEIWIFLIMTCYGGGFATMPAYISDIFGTKKVSEILGLILTAWSAAGIAGPTLFTLIYKHSGSFDYALRFCGLLFVVSLVISFLLMAEIRRLRGLAAVCPAGAVLPRN